MRPKQYEFNRLIGHIMTIGAGDTSVIGFFAADLAVKVNDNKIAFYRT